MVLLDTEKQFSRTIINHKDEIDGTIEIKRLLCFSKLLNTVVGDAMTDLLAVEMLLKHYDWTVETWNSMYKELPNVQRTLKVIFLPPIIISESELLISYFHIARTKFVVAVLLEMRYLDEVGSNDTSFMKLKNRL